MMAGLRTVDTFTITVNQLPATRNSCPSIKYLLSVVFIAADITKDVSLCWLFSCAARLMRVCEI
jgi:hypothetical protein